MSDNNRVTQAERLIARKVAAQDMRELDIGRVDARRVHVDPHLAL
jgi:hypothetical protein